MVKNMYRQYINGKCVEGKGKISAVYNPATDEVVGEVSCANAEIANSPRIEVERIYFFMLPATLRGGG